MRPLLRYLMLSILGMQLPRRAGHGSFYTGSRQNYRDAECGATNGGGIIALKLKHLQDALGVGAFGTQTVYRKAGRGTGPAS